MQIAEAVAHPSSLMWAAHGLGLLALRQGDLPRAIPLLERAMSISVEADLPLFLPRMAAALGTAYSLGGRSAEAVPLLTQAVNQTTAKDMAGFQALCRLPLAEALGMRPLQAHCHRVLGVLYLKIDRVQRASPELSNASSLYRAMEMSLQLPQVESALAQLEGRTTA